MYRLVDNPFENSTLKEELEAVFKAQERATAMGGFLVTEYDQHFLPQLDKLAGVKRSGYRSSRNDGLIYGWTCEFGEIKALPGAPYGVAIAIPFPGAQLPKPLLEGKLWSVGEAVLDYSTRTITIKNGDLVVTFPSVNINQADWTLLQEVNKALIEQNAGVLAWKLSAEVSNPDIQHLYPDGKVPTIRNEHAQATVTGYATTSANWNATLVYAGLVAHKTALESLHATLLQWKSLSLDGNPAVPDSHFRMEVAPIPDFNLFHAALISDAAIPGKWMPQDEKAYALVLKQPGQNEVNVEALLERAMLVRLREVLPHPVKDEWARELFAQGLKKGLIDRLETDGDCLAGACIHLNKDWTALMGGLLDTNILIV